MLREAIAIGDTIEQAKEAACRELGVESYEAEFEVLQLPVKKTFGLFGGSPAKVRAFIRTSPADAAVDYLRTILGHMGVTDVTFTVKEEENGALISISGEDVGFIIGHRGETLDALQYLAGLVSNHVENSYYRVTLDIGNYREKRRETLEVLGRKIAAKAVRTGRNTSLEPMNPYERRIIHTAVQTVEGAKSWSEGEDLGRHVVIGPIEGERPQPQRRPKGRRPDGKGGRPQGGRPPRAGSGSRPPRRDSSSAPRPQAAPQQPAQRRDDSAAPLYGRIDVKK
ncbi:MAG: single-stranded DNA-binding protein [Clostridiales bacterium]|nr:KH domain-containing protein [Clostridiales bacterium]PWM41697.1 MAG: single-stranded DNA-binding protein [Clostridiales bacterium]